MLKHLKAKIRHFICQRNFKKKLKEIKNYPKDRKIKVLFLIRENSKWTYESVYREMEKTDKFEPIVAVSLLPDVMKGKDKTRNDLDISYDFFKTRGYNVVKAVENGKYMDLKNFNPDIVFYDQPGIPTIHHPFRVSFFALTMYCDYGFEFFYNPENYKSNFHALLYKFFVDNKKNIERYMQYNKKANNNCIALGYPKLDIYFLKQMQEDSRFWKEENKFKIIYAPHHSLDDDGLKLATFKTNGEFILSLAKKNQETTTWVFKPHPRFKYALLKNKVMSEQQIENYFKEWENIAKIYDKGAYFDIFKSSDLLITDCCSFLGEYLPSKKPIIQLVNSDHSEFNPLGKEITSQNYKAYSCEELSKYFQTLVCEKDDYLKEDRLELIKSVIDYNKPSATKICEYLIETLLEKENHD